MSEQPTANSPGELARANHEVLARRRAIAAERENAADRSGGEAVALKALVATEARARFEANAAAAKVADAERVLREEQGRRWGLWVRSGVPKRHREVADEGHELTEEQVEGAARLRRACMERGISFLLGGIGNGKTQLAVDLIRWAAKEGGHEGRYAVFADLLDDLRHEAYREGENAKSLLLRLSRVWLLVVDEVDKRRWTQDEQLWLARLLDHRYREKNPTILIANLTREGLGERIDMPSLDRSWEGGAVVEFKGESLRRRAVASEGIP